MIVDSFIKWQEVPIVTTVNETSTPISDIPFPAITFCSDIKSNILLFDYYEKLKEFQQNPESVTYEEQLYLIA